MSDELLHRHYYLFNPGVNGGESVHLVTNFYRTVLDGVYYNQEIRMGSYSNEVVLKLRDVDITPFKLRELADELERELQLYL